MRQVETTGFEPATPWLQTRCSTAELRPQASTFEALDSRSSEPCGLADPGSRPTRPHPVRRLRLDEPGRPAHDRPVSTPQSGIFALGTASHAYLEFDLLPGRDPGELVTAIGGMREPRTTMGGVNLVAGFRPELWRAVVPSSAPDGVEGFNR